MSDAGLPRPIGNHVFRPQSASPSLRRILPPSRKQSDKSEARILSPPLECGPVRVPHSRPTWIAQDATGRYRSGRLPQTFCSLGKRCEHSNATGKDKGKVQRLMPPGLYWIPGPWRGKLAIAKRPRGGDWLDDEAAGWRRAGLDIVVSLLEAEEASQLQLDREKDAAASQNITFMNCPIPDRGVPAAFAPVLSVITRIARALESGQTIAIHCRQGIGRSGLIAAGTLITYGTGPIKAAEIVSRSRGLTVPETPDQVEWLRQLSLVGQPAS